MERLGDGRAACVGLDVAEGRRGLDLVALDESRGIIESRGHLAVEAAIALTEGLGADVVCIDSPSSWSTSGRSRRAERDLAKLGIQSFRTGPDPGDHAFYRWMRVGFELFAGLAGAFPLYRGGDVRGAAAEVFPHATACLLAGQLRPSGASKTAFRRKVLRDAGLAERLLHTQDRVDAALAALTGLIALEGGHCCVGDPDEGVILLPVPAVPDARLRQP